MRDSECTERDAPFVLDGVGRVDEAHVRRVRQGWNDPGADGAVLGFGVGIAFSLLAAFHRHGLRKRAAWRCPP